MDPMHAFIDKERMSWFYFSIFIFGVSLLGVLWIENKSPIQRIKEADSFTRGLWGFSSSSSKKDRYIYNTYSWRKLLLAGVMCSSLICFCTIRRMAVRISLGLAFGILTLWILFLLFFWYFVLGVSSETLPSPPGENGGMTRPGEARVIDRDSSDTRLPVTVVTGFLGSGKTTLVKNLLHNTEGMRILVIENEIGETGIDHDLLLQQTNSENIVLMNNGCICCTVRGDLIKTFTSLFASPSFAALHWVVIETTGLADPAPVIQSLYMDENCKKHLRLDAVLTVVDCKHFPQHMEKVTASTPSDIGGQYKNAIHSDTPEAVQQVAFADRIILNKIDLVTSNELENVTQLVIGINPRATIICTTHSQLSVSDTLNLRAFDLSAVPASLQETLKSTPSGIFNIRTDPNGRILKSRVNIKSKGTNNTLVNTVSLTTERPLDLDAFNRWMVTLLREHGNSIYRFKGILWMEGYDEKFVAQGIHMLFNGEKSGTWEKNERRKSTLVFIGVDLPIADIKSRFYSCCINCEE